MKSFFVSVIIPNYNDGQFLEENLPSLLTAYRNPVNKIAEIIIVDDNSRDGSLKFISSKYPEVKLVKHRVTRGFSSSLNTGIRTAKGNLACILHTDVKVEPDFLRHAFSHFLNPKIFAVALNNVEDSGWIRGSFIHGFIEYSVQSNIKSHDTFFVPGGIGVFRRNVWLEIGGMDEKFAYPINLADMDLSYRALKRGFRIVWEPESKIFYKHSIAVNQERDQLLFIWKNLTSKNLFRKHLVGLFRRITKHPGYVKIVLMALGRLKILLKARGKEIREAKISDEAIFSRF